MKINLYKGVIAGMALLFCLGNEANAQKKLCLRQVLSQIEGDATYYGYNESGKLDSVYSYQGFYDVETYRLYGYDEKGNMTSETGYGVLPSNDASYNQFDKVFEVLYTFDDQNRLATRTNYNIDEFSADHKFYLGGVYVYKYNEKGVLAERLLYWDEAKTDLFEKVTYIYDEKDQLQKETYYTRGFYGESLDMTVEYYYDEKGHMIKKVTNTLNDNTGALDEDGLCFYNFDENDNLASRILYDKINPEIPSDGHYLIYTDTLSSDVYFPINYEDEMDFFVKSKYVAKQDTIYRRDVEATSYQIFDIQDWIYEEVETAAGIDNVYGSEMNLSVRRDAEGNVIVSGLADGDNIRVYNADGSMVRSISYNGMVQVSDLPRGIYVMLTPKGCFKFSR